MIDKNLIHAEVQYNNYNSYLLYHTLMITVISAGIQDDNDAVMLMEVSESVCFSTSREASITASCKNLVKTLN